MRLINSAARYPSVRQVKTAILSCVLMCGAASANAAVLFSDKADNHTSVKSAVDKGVWARAEGEVALSTNYKRGKQSYQLSYRYNEAQSFLGIRLPQGKKRVFLRWWEVREKAGDFPGALDYDWSAEKTVRFRSATIGSTGVDYALGWEAASGQRGTSGTDGPGQFVIFGNSTASNGSEHLRATPQIQRGQWNMYEVEINLGSRGQSNGAVRIWVNDKLIGERANINLLPSTDANIEEIWVGGWYSGLSPNPAPARRYIDDIVVSDSKIGFGDSGGPVSGDKTPMPPTQLSVQ
jgi:hypothetical protein